MPAVLGLTAAGFAGFAALLPVAPLWALLGGADEAGSGLVNAVLMFATILTQGFVPGLVRRFGAAPVLGTGLTLLGGPSLLHLFSGELWWTLTLSAVRGAGFGILTVCGSAAVARVVPPARHGAAIGAFGAAIAVPQVLLLSMGTWLVEAAGFWLVFALGTLPLIGIVFVPGFGRAWDSSDVAAVDATPPTDGGGRRRRLPSGLVRPMIMLLAVTLAGGALITFAPQLVSFPLAATGGLALLTITAALTRWSVGGLADRYGTRPFLGPFVLLTTAGLILCAFAVADPQSTRVVLFLLAMSLTGVAYGGLQNLTLLLSLSAVRRDEYDTASAVWNMGFDAGTGVGSILIGSLAAGLGFPLALMVAAGISIATLPLALARESRRP